MNAKGELQLSTFARHMTLHGKFISKFSTLHPFAILMAMIFIFSLTNKTYSQSVTTKSLDNKNYISNSDTSIVISDSATQDTSKKKLIETKYGIKISKDAIDDVVTATCRDSSVLDAISNNSYLFGKAKVKYKELQVDAGQVGYSQSANTISAAPQINSTDSGNSRGSFTQGKETFSYDSLLYNFKSQRALVRNAQSKYGEGFIHSEQIKRNSDQSLYGSHSVYTTCALDTPHFGIVATKIRIVPNKVVVSGPANINILGVPTPIVLPFALFPISQRQKSGFILPTYTIEQNRGLGLLNGGYYFYLNEHADLKMQANLYTKGSYAVSAITNYSNIYKYNGGFKIYYAYNKTGETFEPNSSITKDFMVNWRHTSDAKARPGETFNASVQVGTSSFYSNNSYDPNQILQNQYQSNISWAKNWTNKPIGLTVSALHSQNTATKQIDVTLPTINFHVTQFNPFQRKHAVGSKWTDKITTSYNVDVLNKATFYDSTFNLSNLSTKDLNFGIKHSIPISASYTVLRYVNMSFSVGYNEYWYLTQKRVEYNNTESKLDTQFNYGFYSARDFNSAVNFSTRIYGMKLFKIGKLRGIRHVVTPTVGLSYHPDFSSNPFNYYYRTYVDTSNNPVLKSYYEGAVIGTPGAGKSGSLNMGIGNNLQIKVRSTKDTTTGYKNITLIDGFGINTSYNMAVDSFNWSNIGLNFRTNIMDKINVSGSATYSPYQRDYTTGRLLPKTLIDNGSGLARFTNANLSLGSNFRSKTKANGATRSEEYYRIMRNAGYNEYVDFNVPWSFNINYSLQANNNYSAFSRKDTLVLSHNATLQGEVNLTERWKLTLNTGYNFSTKQLTLTSIDLYRDLHCWTMHLQAYPFGPRKSYNFTLNVKASVLQDLKITRRRDFRDTPF